MSRVASVQEHLAEIIELLAPDLDIYSGIYPHVRSLDEISKGLSVPILRLYEKNHGLYLHFWFPDSPDSYCLVLREGSPKNTFMESHDSTDPANVRRFLNACRKWIRKFDQLESSQ